MKNTIETQNFYLRPFNKDDFDMFYEWAVTGEAITINKPDDLKDRLNRFIALYNDLGFTKFAVFYKETNDFVGYCGFELLYDASNKFVHPLQENELTKKMKQFAGKNYQNHYGDLELGYRLHKNYWNKGYATEVSKAVCDWAFDRFPIDRIVAFTNPDNIGSQRVLEKVGFQYIQNVDMHGYDRFYLLQKI